MKSNLISEKDFKYNKKIDEGIVNDFFLFVTVLILLSPVATP